MGDIQSTTRARGRGKRLLDVPPLDAAQAPAPAARDASRRSLIRLRLDLHDGPMQDLTAVGFALASLQHELDALAADTSAAQQHLVEVKRQLGEVERALRTAAGGGSEFHTTSIVDLVHAEIARFEQWNGATVELRLEGDVEPATDSQRIALQRVLREALTNVARHADATNVRVELFEEDDAVCLRVADDGRGCEPSEAARRDGDRRLGLTGMRERLRLLDGSLSFASAPGGPTVLTAVVKRWQPASGAPDGAGAGARRRNR